MDKMLIIKKLIKDKGYTQEEFAKAIGVTRDSLAKTLVGNPSLKTLERIAEALNVNVRELFDGEYENDETTIKCPNCGTNIKIKVEK